MKDDLGVAASGPGCQPTASAAVPASSQSGIPNADLRCVGYFDDRAQVTPKHTPPPDAPCPICGEPIGEQGETNWKCRAIAPLDGARSYFIVYHAAHSYEEMSAREPGYLDAIFAWDDAQRRPQ